MGVLRRVVLYFFPIYLAVAEYFIRAFLLPEAEKLAPFIVGPSLVSAAIALLFPVIIPKSPSLLPISAQVQAQLAQHNLAIVSITDQRVTWAGWIILVIMAFVWVATLYIAHETPPKELWKFAPEPLVMGGVTYMVGVILTELKERS